MWAGRARFPGSTGSSSAQAHQQPRGNSKAPGLWQDERSAQHSTWMELGQESPAATGLGVLGQVGVLGAQDRNCPGHLSTRVIMRQTYSQPKWGAGLLPCST